MLVFSPLVLLAVLFTWILLILPSQYSETYLAALQDKCDLLAGDTGKKRIITVGGSGAAFGQRSDLLEKEFPDYTVINDGLYAGLGTAPMLDLALSDIRSGDVVILSPEQNAQTLSGFFGARAMWQAADGRPSLLMRLKDVRRRALLGDALSFAAEKFSFYVKGNAPGGDGVYARSHLNAQGDVLGEGRETNVMPEGMDPDMPIHFDPSEMLPDFIREMNAFADACARKGARVYYHFCPMNRKAVSEEEMEKAAGYTQWLREQLTFPVLGEAQDSILDSVWFFDTNFHLNAAGAQLNTVRMAEDLKRMLGRSTDVSIPIPEAPSAPASASSAGGSQADAEYFTFEEESGAIRLTGLTAEGREKEKLTLPHEIHGLPVTSFAPSVFAGNPVIREITIPSSVRRMENGSFAGCERLERVILLETSPARLSAGADLLKGTDCEIIVPAASYSLYQTSYFWSVHGSRIRPDQENALSEPVERPEAASCDGTMYVDANGGVPVTGEEERIAFPISSAHLRTNTPLGQTLFSREGYVPLCWNTEADGSGEIIPFGSRTDSRDGKTLYMTWVRETPEKELAWEEKDGEAWITGYSGSDAVLALPSALGGCPVTRIVSGAFEKAQIETAILPATLFAIEQHAFEGSRVREIWLYDSLFYVYEESFADCASLQTLHISAATSPRYSISYFGAFADKLDWLRMHADVPKLVLAGGSATRYAYDSEAFQAAFPDLVPVNMGVFAYCAMLPQYRIMQQFMGEGDVLLSAPEFDTVRTQFCISNALDDRFWPLTEADYSCVSLLDLREYTQVFYSFSEYLHKRKMMTARSYEESPGGYDDDGNAVAVRTYNQYGDYTLPRGGAQEDVLLQTYLADYTQAGFPAETVEALNRVYREFQELGVRTFFVYAPRNHSALTEESTKEARQALDRYLRETLCVPVLLDMEDSLYPATQFYLIDNHLSSAGVSVHMQKILPALREALGSAAR